MGKTALITGVTGQDGSYLAELLLEKGYMVHGLKRKSSSFNTERINHLYQDTHNKKSKFKLHYGDLTDSTSLIRLISEIKPDEITIWRHKVMFEFRLILLNTPLIPMLWAI